MKRRFIWMILVFIVLIGSVSSYMFLKKDKDQVASTGIEEPYVEIEHEEPEVVEDFDAVYDVIVIGGEPEGVAAAVSAARNGADVLLIEKRKELGGLFTYGMLNFLDIPQGDDHKSVSRGIFEEWHKLVGGDNAFGILEAKAAFKKLVDDESNITLSTESEVIESISESNQVTALKFKNDAGTYIVKGTTFIDATQDGDFAVMSNAPYFTGGEDIGIKDKKMAVTPMIHLKNVNWDGVKQTAQSNKFGFAKVKNSVAWGFSNLHRDYKPVEENTRLRGLNLVKVGNEYFINALQIFDVDGLDKQAIENALEKGKRETDHILIYLKEAFPGFENAEIISYPTELYVRETRHILAEYQLPMSDVWMNQDHWDSIGFGAYPVDVQAQTPQDYGYVLSAPTKYAIPFRSLVPLEVDNLLVVGRSAGYSSLAAGSARVVPTGMTTGEAAGVAAVLAYDADITVRELSKNKVLIEALRTRLSKQGAYVDHYKTSYSYEGLYFDEAVQTLMNYGLVIGGYENDLHVEKEAKMHGFMNMLRSGISRSNPEKYPELQERISLVQKGLFSKENEVITRNQAAQILVDVFFVDAVGDPWDILIEKGIVSDVFKMEVPEDRVLLTKEMFYLNATMIQYLNNSN